MKIKLYEAPTENEALEKVKNELGLDAVILSIKTIRPRGIFKFFKKIRVEVTAAYEEKEKKTPKAEEAPASADMSKDLKIKEQNERIESLEKKLSDAEELFSKVVASLSLATRNINTKSEHKFESTVLQLFYDALVENGVLEEIAEELLGDLEEIADGDKADINLIVKIVYNKIIQVLGAPEAITFPKEKEEAIVTFLVGPTGVGKTTTIAKLSSHFILHDNKRVGLITADTYRIAAIEQLKIYAEILGLDVEVVYNPPELRQSIDKLKNTNEVIILDTAGRSHKSAETIEELTALLAEAPGAKVFLVLSLTTKYEDLLNIVRIYESICDYNIIFTKADETTCLGTILNICYVTGKQLSYITNGQNVPDDFEIAQPEKIAKTLLGGVDV